MKYENKSFERHVVVTLPHGQRMRVTLPNGKFKLPDMYDAAVRENPVGAAYLKRMTLKKPRKSKSQKDENASHGKDQPKNQSENPKSAG